MRDGLKLICRPIGDTVGMAKLTPKGSNVENQIPMGSMGKKGTCSALIPDAR